MGEVNPIVMEKYEFEYRGMSKLISFLTLFGIGFRRKDKDPSFCYLIVLPK